MTNDATHEAVVAWIASVANVVAIAAHQGGKAPAEPYIMVNMTGFFQVRAHEQDIEYAGTTTVTATPIIEGEWRFSVHSYGPSPTDILRPIVSAVKLTQMMEPLMPELVIHQISQIRNVPDWINNQWQPRGQMDITVRGLIKDGHIIDVIEQTTIETERA